MKNEFTVNEKKYVAKPFTFNLMCDFEDLGVSLSDMANKSMSTVRTYFAICAGIGLSEAGQEIETHIINGGSIEPIAEAMSKELESSDFFRSLNKNMAKKVQ